MLLRSRSRRQSASLSPGQDGTRKNPNRVTKVKAKGLHQSSKNEISNHKLRSSCTSTLSHSGGLNEAKHGSKPESSFFSPTLKKKQDDVFTESLTRVVPPWENLPYLILEQIFSYCCDDPAWLVRVACMSRAFTDPALSALYRKPPLNDPRTTAKIISTLVHTHPSSTVNYRRKVRTLELDVGRALKHGRRDISFNLVELFQNVPGVRHVRFFHESDAPPFNHTEIRPRWTYPDQLFNNFFDVPTEDSPKLCSWEWNYRMLGHARLDKLLNLHTTLPFQHLKNLSLVNFQFPTKRYRTIDRETQSTTSGDLDKLALCISTLSNLDYLKFQSCHCVDSQLLRRLSKQIKCLEFVNCPKLTAKALDEYLQVSGSQLECLYLQHNEILSLSFLPQIGISCPRLRKLRVGLHRSTKVAVHENNEDTLHGPSYDGRMTSKHVPNWPSSLAVIEILDMKQWTIEGASMLFQSLVDNARCLPNLRYLSLSVRLPDASWRERSQLRDMWYTTLRNIYLRDDRPPKDCYSLSDVAKLKAATRHFQSPLPSVEKSWDQGRSSRRLRNRSKQVCYRESEDEESTDNESHNTQDSSHPKDAKYPEETHAHQPQASPTSNNGKSEVYFIQGKCNVVDITIDNLKPVEVPFQMRDFLDPELTDDDEEWNGVDLEEDTGFAW